ncbi:hypothetical protein [Bacillus methanolicus]|uniref:hypothetical protein n=1 Tax=Bacillus methanolicus TaxID=1471 RepID=UPI00138B193C|nr:hypothetical protein [Bacillus methanolicus]
MSKNPFFDLNEGMKQVKGTMAIEGFYLRAEEEELIKAKTLGLISEEEFLRKVLELSYE